MPIRRLTLLALYTTIALTLFVAEAQIPVPVPIPGVKLGLSNIVTLAALLFLGRKEAGLILTARILLGALLIGVPSMILFSAAGGLLAFLVMAPAVKLLPRAQIWVVGILGAIAHNTGQLLMAVVYLRTTTVLLFAPMLLLSAIITGCITGLAAKQLLRYESWLAR
ncbi:MAG: Gx transporter family protein [Oscillospiraceae bacterium]|nr:Gx transporter family protein [Oscillospiraceae bacterium]